MNEFDPHRPGEHEEVALLLPWYVNQTLDGGELARVQAHLRHCLICHREVLSLQSLSTALAGAPLLDLAPKAAFAQLQRRLPPRAGPVDNRPARRGSRLSLPRAAWAVAASLLLVAALARWQFQASQPTAFHTLASRRSAPVVGEIQLVFAAQLPGERIDALLRDIDGRIVAGPNAMGAFAVRLGEGGRPAVTAAALAFLRRQEGVILAEPIISRE